MSRVGILQVDDFVSWRRLVVSAAARTRNHPRKLGSSDAVQKAEDCFRTSSLSILVFRTERTRTRPVNPGVSLDRKSSSRPKEICVYSMQAFCQGRRSCDCSCDRVSPGELALRLPAYSRRLQWCSGLR